MLLAYTTLINSYYLRYLLNTLAISERDIYSNYYYRLDEIANEKINYSNKVD